MTSTQMNQSRYTRSEVRGYVVQALRNLSFERDTVYDVLYELSEVFEELEPAEVELAAKQY